MEFLESFTGKQGCVSQSDDKSVWRVGFCEPFSNDLSDFVAIGFTGLNSIEGTFQAIDGTFVDNLPGVHGQQNFLVGSMRVNDADAMILAVGKETQALLEAVSLLQGDRCTTGKLMVIMHGIGQNDWITQIAN